MKSIVPASLGVYYQQLVMKIPLEERHWFIRMRSVIVYLMRGMGLEYCLLVSSNP